MRDDAVILKMPAKEHYDRIFEAERDTHYPLIDRFEKNWGFAINRERLEGAARVLACPMKINPPNWQHGRIIYAVLRSLLRRVSGEVEPINLIDIGTAKGFSALVMLWATQDAGVSAAITSCDVIDPEAKVRRNTVAEVDGLKTLYEILAPWPEHAAIQFKQLAGATTLAQSNDRVQFAFIDGKHNFTHVSNEASILKQRQHSGDIAIFDDVQIDGVRQAVERLDGYQKDYMSANAHRTYCIATRL